MHTGGPKGVRGGVKTILNIATRQKAGNCHLPTALVMEPSGGQSTPCWALVFVADRVRAPACPGETGVRDGPR